MEKGKGQLEQLQEDADQVVVIMKKNYNKVKEREEKLEDLDKRADALLESNKQFRKTTKKLRQKAETENARLRCKNWRVIAGVVALIIIITIITIIIIITTERTESLDKTARKEEVMGLTAI